MDGPLAASPAAASAATPARLLRERIRAGEHTTVTTGLAPGHLQANLVILPADWAEEFAAFCAANPKPCPLIAMSAPGDPALPELGPGIDVRSDLPRYRVFRDGAAVSEETDIGALWRDDLVAFALGCSYSFEAALLEAGVPIRHIEQGKKVCTYPWAQRHPRVIARHLPDARFCRLVQRRINIVVGIDALQHEPIIVNRFSRCSVVVPGAARGGRGSVAAEKK